MEHKPEECNICRWGLIRKKKEDELTDEDRKFVEAMESQGINLRGTQK